MKISTVSTTEGIKFGLEDWFSAPELLRAVRKMSISKSSESTCVDRIKMLYPMVNEAETPLPRSWSPKDKFNFIGLSQNNLRVHYKGT